MGSGAASGSGDNNADPLINALLDKSGVSAVEEPVIIMVKDPNTHVEFIVEAFLRETILNIKAKIQVIKNLDVDKQRLIFAGKPLNNDTTLSSLNLGEQATRGKTVHLTLELQGGARKGMAKVKKNEKLHTTRAKCHYAGSQVQPGILAPALLATVSQPGFIYTTVGAMDPLQPGLPPAEAAQRYQRLIALSDAIHATTRAAQTIEAAAPLLVPVLTNLKAQKEAIEVCMSAINSAVEQSFAEDYYLDTGYNLDAFFERVDTLREQADIQAEVQRQVALSAAAAAVPTDDMDL